MGETTDTEKDVEWPCFVYYKLVNGHPKQQYQGVGYKGIGSGGFLITHGETPEELADRMKGFVQGMANWQDRPLKGAAKDSPAEKLTPDEERRFLERLGLKGSEQSSKQ